MNPLYLPRKGSCWQALARIDSQARGESESPQHSESSPRNMGCAASAAAHPIIDGLLTDASQSVCGVNSGKPGGVSDGGEVGGECDDEIGEDKSYT